MKQHFLRAPWSVRTAAVAMAVYPLAISVYSFRLYARPKNPDAWFVIGILEAAYLLPAFGVVSGSRLARWFCLGWVALSILRGAFSISALSGQLPLQVFVITNWVIQTTVVSLLFTPSGMLFFKKKEPIIPQG